MKKNIILLIIGLFAISCNSQKKEESTEVTTEVSNVEKATIYDYVVKDIDGNDFNFSDLKGKKIMVVNTASKCGFTPQYEQLEAIYEKYKDQNFVIVGFPANNFRSQEPGSNEDIKQFCTLNYGVTFPMMSKISVVGDDMEPIYQFLTKKSINGVQDSQVEWNFQKYLIGEDGTLEKVFYTKVSPDAPEIIAWIENQD